jgi:glycosyltransferase involved in cell wall biosynthesis
MSAPLDVLFLIRSLRIGGAERQLALLARAMHASGHRVRVATFYGGGAFEADLRQAGVPVIDLHKSGRWDVLAFFWRLVRLLRQEKPAIVHGYLPMSNILLWLARFFAPACKLVWGVRVSDFDPGQYGWMGRLEGRLERWLAGAADLIICNSWKGLSLVRQRGFPVASTACVPNGIDTQKFQPDLAAGLRMRRAWGIDERCFLFGLVGRLDPVKNHPGFIAAAARLAAELPEPMFVCIGPGPDHYAHALREQALAAGLSDRMWFTGGCEDMPAAYNALNVFVSASLSEGSPNVLGEAMACDVSAITTDVGDAAWLMADYGQVIPPGDVDALYAAMRQAYLDRARPPVHTPRARIIEVFDAALLEQRTVELLSALALPASNK